MFVLLAAGVASFFIFPGLFGPKDVVIPDVSAMPYEDAVTDLHDMNLDTEREQMYSEEVDEGVVIRTDPSAGTKVKEEDTVTLIVSEGEEEVSFKDYTGKDYNQTKQLLETQGYNVASEESHSKNVSAGNIISHIRPAPGTGVKPSETDVKFEVSIGPKPIELSNLQGMTEEKAMDTLKEQGLSANIQDEHSETVPKGEVIRQEPESGKEMSEGDTVDVYISSGPEEKPPKNHQVTFTVPYSLSGENDESDTPPEQTVKIYIGDKNRTITEVYDTYTISDDREFTITLTIAPDSIADYKVYRDDNLFIDKSISYEDAEGE